MPDETEKLQLGVDIPDEIEASTRSSLEALKAEIEASDASVVGRLTQHCLSNKINYRVWTPESIRDDASKQSQLSEVLAYINPNVGYDLIKLLQNEKGKEVAGEILKVIVDKMQTHDELHKGFEEAREDLSTDFLTDKLAKGTEMVAKNFNKHPWATAAFVGIIGITAMYAWQHETAGKYFRRGLAVAALGWAANYGVGLFSEDGRTALDKLMSTVKKDEVSEFLEEFKGNDKIDAEAIIAMLQLGDIPFGKFLSLYDTALKRGDKAMDMSILRQAGRRLGIESEAFDKKHAEGLFEIMDEMVQGNVDEFRKKYVSGPEGEYSFLRVFNLRYRLGEGAAAAAVAGGTADGKAPKAAPKTPSRPEKPSDAASTSEIESIDGFSELSPDLKSDGTAEIMGYQFRYSRRPSTTEEKVDYNIKDIKGTLYHFESGKDADEAKNKDQLKKLTDRLRSKTEAGVSAFGLDPKKVEWKEAEGKWTVPYKYTLDAKYGTAGLDHPYTLEARADANDRVSLALVKADGSEMFFDTKADLEHKIGFAVLEGLLSAQPGPLHGKSLIVESTSTYKKGGVDVGQILGKVDGADFRFEWDGKKYELMSLGITPAFIESKVAEVEADPKFNQILSELYGAAPELSLYGRSTLDLLGFEKPSNTNEEWKAIVDFKHHQVITAYRRKLEGIDPKTGDVLAQVETAKRDTIDRFSRDFTDFKQDFTKQEDLAKGLRGATPPEQARATSEIARMQDKLVMHGYGPEYQEAYGFFQQSLEGTNFANLQERSNAEQYHIWLTLQTIWFDKTAFLAEDPTFQFDPDKARAGGSQDDRRAEYIQYVTDKIVDIVRDIERTPSQEGWFEHAWQKYLRKGVSEPEVESYLAERGFDQIKEYVAWKGERGIHPELEAAVPLLQGVEGYTTKPGTKPGEKLIIVFGDGTEWKISETTPGKFELSDAKLTPTTIALQVEALRGNGQFNQYFDRLETAFDGSDWDWQNFLPFLTERLDLLPFSDGWVTRTDEGAWVEMVHYKKWEATTFYEQGLYAIMDKKLPPADEVKEIQKLNDRFAVTYLKGARDLSVVIGDAVRDSQTQGKTITEQDFDGWLGMMEFMQYSDDYKTLMDDSRDYYDLFNYAGFESMEAEGPYRIENLAMQLLFRYTAFLNDPDGNRKLTGPEKAYFKHVQREVDRVVKAAMENNQSKEWVAIREGLHWMREGIWSDEIPRGLQIEDFETWKKRNPDVTEPDLVIPGPVTPPPTPPTGGGGGDKPSEGDDSSPEEKEVFEKEMEVIYQEHWAKRVTPDHMDELDQNQVGQRQKEIDKERVNWPQAYATDPSRKKELLDNWAKFLDKHFAHCEK